MNSGDTQGRDPYEGTEPNWNRKPNPVLVQELSFKKAGRALDVGAGDGAEAIWLVKHGWPTTALEPSPIALDRARQNGARAGAGVDWLAGSVADADLPAGGFELVVCCNPTLTRDAAARLPDLVTPGGTLLVIQDADPEAVPGFDATEHLDMDGFRALVAEGWTVELDHTRPRTGSGNEGTGEDLVLRATKG